MFNSPQTNKQTNRAFQKTSAGEHLGLPASGTAPQTDAAGADPQQGACVLKVQFYRSSVLLGIMVARTLGQTGMIGMALCSETYRVTRNACQTPASTETEVSPLSSCV